MSDRGRADPDPSLAGLLEPQPAAHRPPRSQLRDPARVLVVVGALAAIACSPLPWLTKVGNPPPETVGGWGGLFDGFLIAALAILVLGLVLNRDVADSTTWIVRWLPTIAGVAMLLLGVSALRNMDNQIRSWSTQNATGVYQPALWGCLAGVALVNVGTLVLGARRLREPRRARRDPLPRRASWSWVASIVCGTIGCVVGIGLAVIVVLGFDVNPVALGLALLIGTFVGGLVGARVGASISRSLWPEERQG